MKVYFNNSCKICKAEIDLYKKEKIEEIDWIDITDNKLAEQETSKNRKQLLRSLFNDLHRRSRTNHKDFYKDSHKVFFGK